MDALTVLKNARARIEKGWCRGVLARTATGEVEFPNSEAAVSFCVVGAVIAETTTDRDLQSQAFARLKRSLSRLYPNRYLSSYNDSPTTSHADILALYDRAIEAVEKEAAHASR